MNYIIIINYINKFTYMLKIFVKIDWYRNQKMTIKKYENLDFK